jgi:hypothetical protein
VHVPGRVEDGVEPEMELVEATAGRHVGGADHAVEAGQARGRLLSVRRVAGIVPGQAPGGLTVLAKMEQAVGEAAREKRRICRPQ